MNKNKKLYRALVKSFNRFHETLKSEGFHVSYSIDDGAGAIFEDSDYPSWPVGELEIRWKINGT